MASVTLTLPENIRLYPSLHTRIYNEGETDLNNFLQKALKDHEELKVQGYPSQPFFKTIRWYISVNTKTLVSAYAQIDLDTGGAHPNSEYQSLLWDVKKDAEITNTDLFDPLIDQKPIDAYLCKAIESERTKRTGSPQSQGANCPKLSQSRLVMIAASIPGKIGAVDIVYAPYEVGSYAEGPYFIRLPQTVFKPYVKSTYHNAFDGEVAPQPINASQTASKAAS